MSVVSVALPKYIRRIRHPTFQRLATFGGRCIDVATYFTPSIQEKLGLDWQDPGHSLVYEFEEDRLAMEATLFCDGPRDVSVSWEGKQVFYYDDGEAYPARTLPIWDNVLETFVTEEIAIPDIKGFPPRACELRVNELYEEMLKRMG